MADVDVSIPEINANHNMIQPENAVQIIRDLVLKVCFYHLIS